MILCVLFFKENHTNEELEQEILSKQSGANHNKDNVISSVLKTTDSLNVNIEDVDKGIFIIENNYIIAGTDTVQKLEQIGFVGIYEYDDHLYKDQQAKFDTIKGKKNINIISSAKESCSISESIITGITVNSKKSNGLSVIFPGGISIISSLSKIEEIYGDGILHESENISQIWYENDDYTLVVSYYTTTGEVMELRYLHAIQQ